MADAVRRLRPGAKVAIGPSIETGFYYDFDTEPFAPEDAAKIEAEMAKIIAENGLYPAMMTNEVKTIFAKVLPDPGSLAYYIESVKILPFNFSKYGSMQEQAIIKVTEEYIAGKVSDAGLPARVRGALEDVVSALK